MFEILWLTSHHAEIAEINKLSPMRPFPATIITLFLLVLPQVLGGQTVSTKSLIGELTDLQQLAEFPQPGYRSVQFSSYDRRSVRPDQPGWFANDDGFGGEPVPGFMEVIKKPDQQGTGEYLICDVKGPGAIVRLWTAAIEGDLTLWLDGRGDPLYNGPAQEFFMHTYEALLKERARPEWTGTLSQNMASYYPIPFAKGCRMVWKGNLANLHFYHVQMRLYDEGSSVKTFKLDDIRENEKKLNEVAGILSKPFEKLDQEFADAAYDAEWLKPGDKKLVKAIKGQEAIKKFAVFVTARDLDKALRQILLEIRFDGSPWGQVQSPVGDFFGAAPGINPYESLPFTVLPDGRMVCRYFMPFRDSAQIWFENLGDQEVTVTTKVIQVPYNWKEGKSMHFRARWRVDHDLVADPRQVRDMPYLLIKGQGRMVGAAAFIMNPTSVPSSYGNWWGEGDEKIFIDNNPQPSFIGTGSEDYFNYAWSSEELFAHAYCGQPRNDGPANRGFITNYRYHILDNIPFTQGFDFYMELYSHRVVRDFTYGRMIYLYAIPGCHDDHLPISQADVRHLKLPAYWWPEADGQAVNSIFYQTEDLATDRKVLDLVQSAQWAAGQLAVWTPQSMEDQLILIFPVTKTGKYMLGLTVARMAKSGKMQVLVDDQAVKFNGNEIHDLTTGYRDVSRNLNSGELDLTEGIHVIKIKPAGDKVAPIGIDFLWVKKL